jgi:hypothetical protein
MSQYIHVEHYFFCTNTWPFLPRIPREGLSNMTVCPVPKLFFMGDFQFGAAKPRANANPVCDLFWHVMFINFVPRMTRRSLVVFIFY